MYRKALHTLAALPVLVGVSAVAPPPASAAASTAAVVCAGTEVNTFTPGITLSPRDIDVEVSANLAPCVSPGAPEVTAASLDYRFRNEDYSCLSPLDTTVSRVTIDWNSGPSSTFDYTVVVNNLPSGAAVITQVGQITAGQFAGSAAQRVVTGAGLDPLGCLTSEGVTFRTAATTLTIFELPS